MSQTIPYQLIGIIAVTIGMIATKKATISHSLTEYELKINKLMILAMVLSMAGVAVTVFLLIMDAVNFLWAW